MTLIKNIDKIIKFRCFIDIKIVLLFNSIKPMIFLFFQKKLTKLVIFSTFSLVRPL